MPLKCAVRYAIMIFALFALASGVYAKTVAGVNLPDTIMAYKTPLRLNGAGIRTKFFVKLYVGALYLTGTDQNAEKIIHADEPMAIRLHIVSEKITSERMKTAAFEGFKKATHGNLAPIQLQMDTYLKSFEAEIKINDIYDFIYIPGKGVDVLKNSKPSATIEGFAFKEALFGIWLCDDPADQKLKEGMLGYAKE